MANWSVAGVLLQPVQVVSSFPRVTCTQVHCCGEGGTSQKMQAELSLHIVVVVFVIVVCFLFLFWAPAECFRATFSFPSLRIEWTELLQPSRWLSRFLLLFCYFIHLFFTFKHTWRCTNETPFVVLVWLHTEHSDTTRVVCSACANTQISQLGEESSCTTLHGHTQRCLNSSLTCSEQHWLWVKGKERLLECFQEYSLWLTLKSPQGTVWFVRAGSTAGRILSSWKSAAEARAGVFERGRLEHSKAPKERVACPHLAILSPCVGSLYV